MEKISRQISPPPKNRKKKIALKTALKSFENDFKAKKKKKFSLEIFFFCLGKKIFLHFRLTPRKCALGGGARSSNQNALWLPNFLIFGKTKFFVSADFLLWGSPRGPPKFSKNPSFEIQAYLCKVLFYFHSKLRLGPKSGF